MTASVVDRQSVLTYPITSGKFSFTTTTEQRDLMRNYFQNDDYLESEDCPCANTDEGFDPSCTKRTCQEGADL